MKSLSTLEGNDERIFKQEILFRTNGMKLKVKIRIQNKDNATDKQFIIGVLDKLYMEAIQEYLTL
ncbi:hypothetical protein [uncultured Robinsoniella sp.]|uniref:hypothetical protein n=1 Tax=uncultured Robinsoniella sp. TaxID=904190 RepID=UPI00374E513A